MQDRVISNETYDNDTKNKILNSATELFALKGFAAVTMRDIAAKVGIKTGSIYYFYESKEAIIEDALSRFEKGYRDYFNWLTENNAKADSLEALMDNFFNKEFLEVRNPLANLGMSLAIKEQHNNEAARKCVFELLYDFSIKCIQADIDRLIKKGAIPPSNSKIIATMFMFFVITCNDFMVHEYNGMKTPLDAAAIYDELKKMMSSMLSAPDGRNRSR